MPRRANGRSGRIGNGSGLRRKKLRSSQARSRADRQLAQGAGKAVTRAFGSRGGPSLRCWDAFHPSHLSLPRATGPYTVVRTTATFTTNAKYVQFGTFMRESDDFWSNIVGFASVDSTLPINSSPGNATIFSVPFPGVNLTGSTFSCVPAALSVQLMNQNPLSTTSGMIFGAVCKTQLDINSRSETFNDIAAEAISYFQPRLMSAGKLALRGVQANAYPLNMSKLADFQPMLPSATGSNIVLNGSVVKPVGFSPIVFVNQDSDTERESFTFLVSVEWRVRFDIGNPAVASHIQHPTSTDATWDAAVRRAASLGHGMADIVEAVANAGEAATRIGALMA